MQSFAFQQRNAGGFRAGLPVHDPNFGVEA